MVERAQAMLQTSNAGRPDAAAADAEYVSRRFGNMSDRHDDSISPHTAMIVRLALGSDHQVDYQVLGLISVTLASAAFGGSPKSSFFWKPICKFSAQG